MSYRPLRLPPGVDLRRALEEAAQSEPNGAAFVVAGIGSLVHARLRLADANEETVLTGPFEILTLSGTLTPQGTHLHISVSDAQGRVYGGHLVPGNEVRTTAEVLLASLPDWRLSREFDVGTGFQELVVRPEK